MLTSRAAPPRNRPADGVSPPRAGGFRAVVRLVVFWKRSEPDLMLLPAATSAAPPTAATITVDQTLRLLDGPFTGLAQGVGDGRYALWLGSGISRDVVDDLKKVVAKVLRYLRDHADFGVEDCIFAEALGGALALAQLSAVERATFDPTAEFDDWDPEVTAAIVSRLLGQYSKLLNIRVRGKKPDFLLWEVINVASVYADPALEPECEHLCVGVLAIEGVVQEVLSANWDGLIEKAVDELAGPQVPLLKVCVVAHDFVGSVTRTRLLKFHGCAVRARDNPSLYRDLLVGRQPQIENWAKDPAFAVMRQQMVSVATIRHTLMIGLSAQDTNIRDVFRDGKEAMAWTWPSYPPAYVFAEDTVGDDQKVILNSVYRQDYDKDPYAVVRASQIRAFAKPLLVALVLEVLRRKLAALARCAAAPKLSVSERENLEGGLKILRDRVAARADTDRTLFVRSLVAEVARALRLLRGVAGFGNYEALGTLTINQIPADPANGTSGLPEMAAALCLLGLGESAGDWTVERPDPSATINGSVRVIPSGRLRQRVFFVANQEAALQLYIGGALGDNDPDAVIIYSTAPEPRPTRSPRARRRTGVPATRRIGMRPLLAEAPDLGELCRQFRIRSVL